MLKPRKPFKKAPPLAAVAALYQGSTTPRNKSAMASMGNGRAQRCQWPRQVRKAAITRAGNSRPTGPLASTAMPLNRARAMRPMGSQRRWPASRWLIRKPKRARLMALARNMSVVAVRPQPIQPGVVASTPAATQARISRVRGASRVDPHR